MLKTERKNQIMELLKANRFVTVKMLGERLFSSESSIRRDLADLEREGLVIRSYGGAEIVEAQTTLLPFKSRAYDHVSEKEAIASKAVSLIRSGDVVFLDQSSTSVFLAKELLKMSNLTVVTNNVEILCLLSDSKLSVVATGGTISRRNTNCLMGDDACRVFEGIYANIAFFATKSLSDDGVISDHIQEEVFVRNAMFRSAEQIVFLCDSSKLHSHSVFKQCTLSDVSAVVCENDLAQKQFASCYPNVTFL